MKGVYTVVIVTHDIEEARRVSDDVAYLRAGQIVEFGATQAMFDAPRLAATRRASISEDASPPRLMV
jgi:phosphate transport system ATP-binding protein